jgi:hypothetical protein
MECNATYTCITFGGAQVKVRARTDSTVAKIKKLAEQEHGVAIKDAISEERDKGASSFDDEDLEEQEVAGDA